jgi:hypothetical protein
MGMPRMERMGNKDRGEEGRRGRVRWMADVGVSQDLDAGVSREEGGEGVRLEEEGVDRRRAARGRRRRMGWPEWQRGEWGRERAGQGVRTVVISTRRC